MAAAAIAKFRVAMFANAVDLAKFVNSDNSPVVTITAIVTNTDGQFVLYYLIA